jgi:hypothetical protein
VSYSIWVELREWAVLLADIGILAILIIEFNYDKTLAEKRHYKKRIKREPKLEEAKNIGDKAKIGNPSDMEQKQGTPGNT